MLKQISPWVLAALISVSSLAQESPENSQDATLTSQVNKALTQTRAVDAKSINVQTRDGVVQLSGFVKSEEARDAALKAAVGVPGVERVLNELAVEEAETAPAESNSDEVIAARVKSRLEEAGLPDGNDVQVDVQHGAVQLSGFVGSVESKTRAADVASTVAGVTDV